MFVCLFVPEASVYNVNDMYVLLVDKLCCFVERNAKNSTSSCTVVLHVLYCKAARMHLPTNRASASLKGTGPYIVSPPVIVRSCTVLHYCIFCMWEVGRTKKRLFLAPLPLHLHGHGPPGVEITGPFHE
jgi:hypothetical protein